VERGIVTPPGRRKREEELAVFADEAESAALSARIGRLIDDRRGEWRARDERIAAFAAAFVSMARNAEVARRLMTIPGIGTINAAALAAAVGDARTFRRGRDMAAWLGLAPRQMTTGGKPRLLGVGKRGNRCRRKNLIRGARAAPPYLVARDAALAKGARRLLARTHKNVVIVALADKLARIAWAILAHGRIYEPGVAAAASGDCPHWATHEPGSEICGG